MKDIPGWLTTREAYFLSQAALETKQNIGVIVEIGSFHGKSTINLARAGEPVYAVDPHKGNFSGGKTRSTLAAFLKNIKEAHAEDVIHPIVKTSKQASAGWKLPIKMLFIDGLHDRAHAWEDYSLWAVHVGTGGIVAMHDAFCGWPGAGSVAMDRIVRSGEYKDIGVIGSIIYGVKGVASTDEKVRLFLKRYVIEVSQWIYGRLWIPRPIAFFLVHRVLKILLLNRFSLGGSPTDENSAGKQSL